MGRDSYLTQRGGSGSWYYRRRYPADVVAQLGPVFGRSLRTGLIEDARRRQAQAEMEYWQTIEAARGALASTTGAGSPAERPLERNSAIVSRSAPPALPTDPSLPELTFESARSLATAFFRQRLLQLDLTPPSKSDSDAMGKWELDQLYANTVATLSDADDPETLRVSQHIAAQLLNSAGIRAERTGSATFLLNRLVGRALLQLVAIEHRRANGDYSDRITDAEFLASRVSVDVGVRPQSKSIRLGELIERFDRECIQPEDITPKTIGKNRAALEVIKRHFGANTLVGSLEREAFVGFRDTIAKLPPNFTKLHPVRAKLDEIGARNAANGGRTLDRQTQATYLRLLHRLFKFAAGQRIVAENLASELNPLGKKKRLEARRNAFSPNQLKAIFNAPLYRGCVDDERNFAKSGPAHPRRARFWVPLIGLFAGLRLNEILQLTPDHVQTAPDGLPFFSISPDMQVKTDNGLREVPMHSELLRMGFAEFVEGKRRSGATLLFDDIEPGSDGYRSSLFSKRFATFLRSLSLDEPGRRVSFHSFRHNFRDGLRQPQANPDMVREVGGWARSADTSDTYGDGSRAAALRSLINGIRYDCDLAHLYV